MTSPTCQRDAEYITFLWFLQFLMHGC